MPAVTYLFFNGNCAAAMRTYERIFGGKLDLMTVGQSPESSAMPAASPDHILHAHLEWPGGTLMASDDPTAMHGGMSGFGVALTLETAEETRRIFDQLAAGGEVRMPLGKTFFSESFGMVIDRFGVLWLLQTDTPADGH